MSHKEKVLFMTAPNISLFSKKQYIQLSAAALQVVGGLKSKGFDVDHYEVHARLNHIRELEDELSEQELFVLSHSQGLKDYLNNERKAPLLDKWLDKILEDIDLDSYDYFAISLPRPTRGYQFCVAVLHFSIALANKLPKKCFIGGKLVLREVGEDYLYQLAKGVKEFPVESFILGNARKFFPQFLEQKRSESNLVVKTEESRYQEIPVSAKVTNPEDILFHPLQTVYFSKVQEVYPQLQEMKPFAVVPFEFSKGCIFTCAFCGDGNIKQKSLDSHEAVNFLELLYDEGYTDFRFFNNNINFHEKYVMEFCNEIVRRNMKIRFSDSANLRICSEEIFSALREAGCIKLWYGTETASRRIMKIINKNVPPEKMGEKLALAHKAGIWNCLNLIYDFPHENEQDFDDTLNFVKENIEFIDGIQCNAFIVVDNASYGRFPEKFGIKLRNTKTNYFSFDFDEIDGLSFEEKMVGRKKKKYRIENELIDPVLNTLNTNDEIIFSLSQITKDKLLKREIISYMFNNEGMDDDKIIPFPSYSIENLNKAYEKFEALIKKRRNDQKEFSAELIQ